MIYTVTFSPSIDYVVDVAELKLGLTNRTSQESLFPGGKGINVSLVLKNLGIDSSAMGFIAGFTGEEIKKMLDERGISTDFIKVNNGFSRINIKIRSSEETEINGQGPKIDEEALKELYSKLDGLKEGDYLVLGGTIPNTMPSDTYEQIAKFLENKKIHLIVDATKDLLLNVLPYKPYLIKPNNHELAEIFDVELDSNAKIAEYGKKLQEMGAENVLISMAGDGAILISDDYEPVFLPAPKGKVVNSVGAGDSSIAGFLSAISNGQNKLDAFKKGVSTGSASAFSELLAEEEDVLRLLETLPEPELIK